MAFGSGPGDGTVALIDSGTGAVMVLQKAPRTRVEKGPPKLQVSATLSGHAGDITGLVGRRDGTVASAGVDGRVIVWTTRPNTNILTDPSIDQAGRVSFSRDGRMLVVVHRNGITLFDVAQRRRRARLPGPLDAALSPDGRLLATSGVADVVALYDTVSKRLVGQLRWAAEGQEVASAGVQISPDGRWLVEKSQPFRYLNPQRTEAEYREQILVVWDLAGRRKLAELRAGPSAVYAGDNDSDVAFGPDGVLAYARNDAEAARDQDLDRVALWDARSRRELRVFDAAGAQALAFAPSGDLLAVGYEDRIELRDTRSSAVLQTIRVPRATAQHLSFGPDGHQLAASGPSGAMLWDVSDPATVPVPAGDLVDREDLGSGGLDSDVAFSPDSRLVAVADSGPEVILWDLEDPAVWQRSLCRIVDRGFTDPERRRFFADRPVPPTCPG